MGTTVLEVAEPSTRCGFVVIEQDGLPFDTQILRTIVQKAGRAFGVRCKVVRGGRLRVGDAFSLGGPDGDAWLSA